MSSERNNFNSAPDLNLALEKAAFDNAIQTTPTPEVSRDIQDDVPRPKLVPTTGYMREIRRESDREAKEAAEQFRNSIKSSDRDR